MISNAKSAPARATRPDPAVLHFPLAIRAKDTRPRSLGILPQQNAGSAHVNVRSWLCSLFSMCAGIFLSLSHSKLRKKYISVKWLSNAIFGGISKIFAYLTA
jgi:hypothetical protein